MTENEYLEQLNRFIESCKASDEKNLSKNDIMTSLSELMQLSVLDGSYDLEKQLHNLSQPYKGVQFFMPVNDIGNAYKEPFFNEAKFIVIFTHEMGRSGAPVVLLDAAKILVNAGYFVLMLSPMDGPLRADICDAGIPVIIDHHLLLGRCETADLREVHKHQHWPSDIFAECADLMIMNTALLHSVVERYMDKNIPILWWLHEGNISFGIVDNCMPEALSDSVSVYYVSEYVKRQLALYGIEYPGEILPYGIEDMEKESFDKEEKLTFITVGAFCYRKGQDLLLDAIFSLPIPVLEKCRFLFVGSPEEKPLYDKVEMYSEGTDYITLLPSMPRQELLKLYQRSDCIICPSRDDPLPVVLTEMMIMEKPCICSDHTGTADFLTDGEEGYLFENENTEALAQKIRMCLENRERLSDMGKKARKLYEEKFTFSVFEQQVCQIVSELLKKAKVRSYERGRYREAAEGFGGKIRRKCGF